jgi:hypothetical protein
VSSANPDATEGHKHNSATVPCLDYYYPKYSRDPRFNWDVLDFGGYFLTLLFIADFILHFIISSSCRQRTFLIQGEYCVSVYVFRLY